MAERVEGATEPRRRRWYPWNEWTDGSVWRATEGKDFTCSPASFQTALHQRARQEGLEVSTGSPTHGIVEFQFTKKGPVVDQDELEAGYPVDIDLHEYEAAGNTEPPGANNAESQ
jgi:hypothetical protein